MTNETNQTTKDMQTVEVTVKYLNALRQAVGLHIDPEIAEVLWMHAQTLDPYGDLPNLPEVYQQIGREYFARSPGDDVWISFRDLPEATRDALWNRMDRQGPLPADQPDEAPF